MIQKTTILAGGQNNRSETKESGSMQQKLIVDFSELPIRSIEKYVVSAEQICVLCGLNRRTSRRIGKSVFRVLNYFPPADLLEQTVYLIPTEYGWSLNFRFVTDPIELETPHVSTNSSTLGSLRRVGEKLQSFEITGEPADGFTIEFSQNLDVGFEVPSTRELVHWGRFAANGNWEQAFELISKAYLSGRAKLKELRDGVSIRREVLDDKEEQANTILSLIASKTDNAVLLLNAKGAIEWLNQACCRTLGVESRDCLKRHAADLFFDTMDQPTPDQATAKKDFLGSLASGHSFGVEYFRESDLESSFWMAFQLTPVRDEHDTIARWIVIGSDVTQRRTAELAMQAARDVAETANKAKSQFLAMMSHEIRTPMNAIMGMTELTLGTRLTAEQRDFLTTAYNSAHALLQILNDILDLSKVEAARLQIEQIDLNLADLVRDTLDTLGFLADTKGIALRCDFPLDIPQDLIGDPVRLRQIIVNLVGNAIKFTSAGEVVFGSELTDETAQNATIHFYVRDTGVGIAEEKTSRIFEAFYQTDASVTRNFGGTGLGLAITSELVRLMGGRIWVESKLGHGSTFHFVLTLPKSTRPVFAPSSTMLQQLNGRAILVVDENEKEREFIVNQFSHWGVATQGVSNGRQALQLMSKEANPIVEVVLVDWNLQPASGFEIATQMQQLPNQSVIPVLIIPSDQRATIIEMCRQAGIEHFVVKPVSPRTLMDATQRALGRAVEAIAVHDMTDSPVDWEQAEISLNVLVVDDHPSNRILENEIMRRRGHQCTQAGSGAQAIELIRKNKFDVVLMDVQMPDQDGLQTTLKIRDLDDANSLVPIIAVTAYVTPDDRQRCIDARMDDYLAKPIKAQELIEKVERWGLTTKSLHVPSVDSTNLAEQLKIQDVPVWASQVARQIAVSVDIPLDQQAQNPPTAGDAKDSQASGKTDSRQSDAQPAAAEENPFSSALARLAGDVELLRLQMGFFIDEAPQLMQNIELAIADQEANNLHLNAHRLKGLVRSYDDSLAEELATALENTGREGDFEKADATRCLLATCIENLSRRIESFRSQTSL